LQSASRVAAFRSIEEIEQQLDESFARAENDPHALALRGELRLHRGEVEAGLADLRKALQTEDDLRVRRVLASTLLDRLRVDFARAQDAAGELEPLVTGTPEEAEFRRLYAIGLQSTGEIVQAFDQYLKLASLTSGDETLEEVNSDWSVSRERWVMGRIQELLSQANPAARNSMLSRIEERLNSIEPRDAPGVVRELSSLSAIAAGTQLESLARLQLARTLDEEDLLRLERTLLPLLESKDRLIQAEATARLAGLYLSADAGYAARPLIQRLEEEFGDVPTVDGRTGTELIAAWKTNRELAAAFDEPLTWPAAQLEIAEHAAVRPQVRAPGLPANVPTSGPLRDWEFRSDEAGQQLYAFDPQGVLQWQCVLGYGPLRDRSPPQQVSAAGHLVMVTCEDRCVLIDALQAENGGKIRKSLTSIPLIDVASDTFGGGFFGSRRPGVPFGVAGPLAPEVFCWQQGDLLNAIDPVTQKMLWVRSNPQRSSAILTDGEQVVARRIDGRSLAVMRAVDGASLGIHEEPRGLVRTPEDAEWGRFLLSVTREIDAVRLGMFDAALGEVAWERTFESPVHWSAWGVRKLAIFEASGKFSVLNVETGTVEMTSQLDPDVEAESVTVIDSPGQVFVAVNRRRPPGSSRSLSIMPQERAVDGTLYALDATTGERQWSAQVERQFIDPSYPAGWPVLVLAANERSNDSPHRRLVRIVIEKRSGQKHELQPTVVTSEKVFWDVAEEEPAIRIQYGHQAVALKFGKEAADSADDKR
jgi:hypothetical protein